MPQMSHTVFRALGAWKPLVAVIAAGLPVTAPDALAQPAPNPVAMGKELARQDCVQCHVVAPTGKGGWTDAPAFAVIANRPGTTAAGLSDTIQKGHIHMLNDQRPKPEADAIAAYIMSGRGH
jgi:mono/diheme cytochrome c family protein